MDKVFMVKNLIFDMGGVIMPMNPIEIPIQRFMSLGMTRQQCEEFFSLWGQQGIFREIESGTITEEEFLHQYHLLTGRETTCEEICWAWRGFVQDPPAQRLHNLDVLRQHYNTILLSNTNSFLMRHCCSTDFGHEGRPIQDYFDQAFYSYELGGCKPDPAVFRRMLDQAGIDPAESLFLDDGLANVQSARNIGLPSIHVPDNQDWMPMLEKLWEK